MDGSSGPRRGDPPPRVLIVEDDVAFSVGIAAALRLQGYEVLAIDSGRDFDERATTFLPDLVLLDIFLPGTLNGFDLGARMRTFANAPIIFLTAADSLEERLRGFDLGADDYIVKPCAIAELLARIQVALRRTGRLTSPTRQIRDLVVDEQTRTVLRAGASVELTRTEFDVLLALVRVPGRVLSKAQLLTQVWGFDQFDPNLVEVYVSSVRRKLEANGPRLIFTERGQGYVIRA
jgi:DNA-binding response OmpR family regulator